MLMFILSSTGLSTTCVDSHSWLEICLSDREVLCIDGWFFGNSFDSQRSAVQNIWWLYFFLALCHPYLFQTESAWRLFHRGSSYSGALSYLFQNDVVTLAAVFSFQSRTTVHWAYNFSHFYWLNLKMLSHKKYVASNRIVDESTTMSMRPWNSEIFC